MQFGSQQLTRTGLILIAIVLTPAWVHAQESSAARTEWSLPETFVDSFPDVGLITADRIPPKSLQSDMQRGSPPIAGPLNSDPTVWEPLLAEPVRSSKLSADPLLSDPLLSESLPSESLPSELLSSELLSSEPDVAASPFSTAGRYDQSAQGDEFSQLGVHHAGDPFAQVPDQVCQHCGNPKSSRFSHRVQGGPRVCENCGCDVQGKTGFGPGLAMRFGWWAVETDGSPVKVGEYQSLASSPFWDLDGVWSNRVRTLDFTLSGLDNEANNARGYFFGPHLSAKFEYQRFLRRLDHVPLSGFDLNSGPPSPTDKVVSDDLNVGEDYAIRVQQLDTSVKGQLTKDLKWKVNLWGMRKSGERQANAMAHCFNVNPPPAAADYTCHVLSQRQNIDWTTMEITPVLEANVGNAVVEYSRTMRAFGQNDQIVERTYTAFDFSPSFGAQGPPFVYGWVPESFTQIDRLKLNVPINDANQLYTHMYLGNTENKFRGTERDFNGFDLRLTNRAIDDVTLAAYAKLDTQRGNVPTDFLTAPPFGVNTGAAGTFEPSSLRHPIEYDGGRVGLKGNWQSPSKNWLSIVGGYEFFDLSRRFANYNTLSGPFSQEDTQTHQVNIGPYMRVSRTLDAYVRYKGGFISNPLIGVREADGRFNTNQPEQLHRVELGGTWTPMPNFIATTMFGIENSWNHSRYAQFDEDNYPILCTIWYAPTQRLSMTGGYAFLSNWIDQDITIGFLNNPTETTQWNYDGYNNLVTASASYAYTPRTQLIAGIQWNRGSNTFAVPPSTAGADWSALPSYSDVIVETRRINLGVDHEFTPSMSSYFRYVHFDYEDLSVDLNSGTADMFLVGLSLLR